MERTPTGETNFMGAHCQACGLAYDRDIIKHQLVQMLHGSGAGI